MGEVARCLARHHGHRNHALEAEELLKICSIYRQCVSSGITGAPWHRKSTLVDRLGAHYRKADQKVGVIAVDPTSPYTGGHTRDRSDAKHAGDLEVLRSMATRVFSVVLSALLGKSRSSSTQLAKNRSLSKLSASGQDEVDIVRLADCVVVILVPASATTIPSMKAGRMEIADIFVLNKADAKGRRLEEQLHAMLPCYASRWLASSRRAHCCHGERWH